MEVAWLPPRADSALGDQRLEFEGFEVAVTPRTGKALLFQHQLLHQGCVVESGTKYVLRSDVMYAD